MNGADRRHRHRLPRRRPAARLPLRRRCRPIGDRERGRGVPSERWPLLATDLLPGVRHLGRAGWRGQHRHRRARGAGAVLAGARRCRRDLVLGHAGGQRQVEKLSTGNMKRTWVDYGKGGTGSTRLTGKARSSCARRRRSRTSGFPTGPEPGGVQAGTITTSRPSSLASRPVRRCAPQHSRERSAPVVRGTSAIRSRVSVSRVCAFSTTEV